MDKILVVIFDGESKAYEGLRILQDLHNQGSLTLYAQGVIAKDASGKVNVKQTAEKCSHRTSVDLLTGSLLDLLSGPGVIVVGADTEMFGERLYDLASLGVGGDFLYEVGQSLRPGKSAIVAEIWEEWGLPVDTRMQALGGVIFRRTRRKILDAQIERDVAMLKAQVAALPAEHGRATGEAEARLQAMQDRIKAKLEASQQELEAKIKSLQEQATQARGDRKAKLEARIAELQADQKRRSDLLHQAWELTQQALAI
jgi:uncharacterized membrane protein